MDLLLIRHALAEDPRPGLDDADRALTPEGHVRFERAARGLARLGLGCGECWHSPWKRARETATLLAQTLGAAGPTPRTRPEPLLAAPPGAGLLDLLWAQTGGPLAPTGNGGEERLALVGHEPWIGQLASLLSGVGGLAVRKGGVVWLRGLPEPGGMALEALLKPGLLRRVGDLRPKDLGDGAPG